MRSDLTFLKWHREFKLLLLTLCIGCSNAYAVDFAEFATLKTHYTTFNSESLSNSSSTDINFGLGISIGFKVADRWDIEPGITFGGENFTLLRGKDTIEYHQTIVQLPLIARYLLSEQYSIGGGLYFTRGARKIAITQNSMTQFLSYGDANMPLSEFGMTGSFRYKFQITELMSLITDIRGLWGLKTLNLPTGGTYHTNSLQLWAGIVFIL